MERENKKRGRAEDDEKTAVRGRDKKQEIIDLDDGDNFKVSDSFQPLGVFEFPWQKEKLVPECDEWEAHDIFRSEVLEGLASVFEFPDEVFCQSPDQIVLLGEKLEEESSPPEEGTDGVDCIWSSVLRQPLSIVPKGPSSR